MSKPLPIETHYAGYRFRSRLEARWKIFFDGIGIVNEYEPDGYVVIGRPYLPDFYLPDLKTFVEIKPKLPFEERELMLSEFLPICSSLRRQTSKTVWLIEGCPGCDSYEITHFEEDYIYPEMMILECRRCPQLWLGQQGLDMIYFAIKPIVEPDCRGCSDRYPVISARIEKAFNQSRSARFEHGEKPFRKHNSIIGG